MAEYERLFPSVSFEVDTRKDGPMSDQQSVEHSHCGDCQLAVLKRYGFDVMQTALQQLSPVIYWQLGADRATPRLHARPSHPYQPELRVSEFGRGVAQVTLVIQRPDKANREVVFAVRPLLRDGMPDCSVCDGKQVLDDAQTGIPRTCWWCHGLGRTALDEAKEIAAALYWSWLRSPAGGLVRYPEGQTAP